MFCVKKLHYTAAALFAASLFALGACSDDKDDKDTDVVPTPAASTVTKVVPSPSVSVSTKVSVSPSASASKSVSASPSVSKSPVDDEDQEDNSPGRPAPKN